MSRRVIIFTSAALGVLLVAGCLVARGSRETIACALFGMSALSLALGAYLSGEDW